MKTIKLNDVQTNFLISALERAGYGIWDDPSAHGFVEEDFTSEETMVEEIGRFKNEVVDKVLEQLKND